MMSTSHDPQQPDLAKLAARRLAHTAPAELSAPDRQRMARRALAIARERSAKPNFWSLPMLAALGTMALVVLGTAIGVRTLHQRAQLAQSERTARATHTARLSRLSLPTGDQLSATADAHFELRSQEPARRSVALSEGAMLFDVAKLGDGQRFDVTTADVAVSVLGTVFTVETHDGHTLVRVYEGRVSITHDGQHYVLDAGGRFVSSASMRATEPSELHLQATAAVERRAFAATLQPMAAQPHAAEPTEPAPTTTEASEPVQNQNLEPAQDDHQQSSPDAGAAPTSSEPLAAAEALEASISRLSGTAAQDAAYRAALLYFEQLDDPAHALYVLQAGGVRGPSRFRDPRSTALYVALLLALHRDWEAGAVARRYIRELPHSPINAQLREAARVFRPKRVRDETMP